MMANGERAEQHRHDSLRRFARIYEEMVDLLCWSAREGIQERHHHRFESLRVRMREAYRPVRTCLQARLELCGTAPDRDPFMKMVEPEKLSDVINGQIDVEELMLSRMVLESCLEEDYEVAGDQLLYR